MLRFSILILFISWLVPFFVSAHDCVELFEQRSGEVVRLIRQMKDQKTTFYESLQILPNKEALLLIRESIVRLRNLVNVPLSQRKYFTEARLELEKLYVFTYDVQSSSYEQGKMIQLVQRYLAFHPENQPHPFVPSSKNQIVFSFERLLPIDIAEAKEINVDLVQLTRIETSLQ